LLQVFSETGKFPSWTGHQVWSCDHSGVGRPLFRDQVVLQFFSWSIGKPTQSQSATNSADQIPNDKKWERNPTTWVVWSVEHDVNAHMRLKRSMGYYRSFMVWNLSMEDNMFCSQMMQTKINTWWFLHRAHSSKFWDAFHLSSCRHVFSLEQDPFFRVPSISPDICTVCQFFQTHFNHYKIFVF
jgi:hypothetical protein